MKLNNKNLNLNFFGKINIGDDFIIKKNTEDENFDYLIFLDSRGIYLENKKKSFGIKLYNYLIKLGKKCLLLNRIKYITVFYTLCNFIKNNPNLKFDNLITNVGFVDFTPKKQEIIDDIILQNEFREKKKNIIIQTSSFRLSNKKVENLSYTDISQDIDYIRKCLIKNLKYVVLISTPVPLKTNKIDRKRPEEFYKNILLTNDFLFKLTNFYKSSIHYGEIIKILDRNLTYDNVHYTEIGHNIFYKILKNYINEVLL